MVDLPAATDPEIPIVKGCFTFLLEEKMPFEKAKSSFLFFVDLN